MKYFLSTLVLICIGLTTALPAVAENLLDVVEKAQRTINQKYPDGSSIARKMAIEMLEKIATGDKTEEEKIAEIQKTFPNQTTEKASSTDHAEQENAGGETLLDINRKIDLSSGVSIEMVKVEAGTFEMSARNGEIYDDEVPHRSTLKWDFFLARTEVTQAQWRAVMGNNPSKYKGDNLPVETVSWNEAMDFCEKLNALGKAPNGWRFTLPTETQWEYACRGGKKSKGYKYSGSNTLNEVAWYYGNSGDSRLDDSSWDNNKLINNHCKTHPVGKKMANELELYDMSGNVWEWCLDDWQDDSSKLIVEFARGNDTGGSKRAIRGGSWSDDSVRSRSSNRGSYSALGYRAAFIGFRPALVQTNSNKTEAGKNTSQNSTGSGNLKGIHEQVMAISNSAQTGNYSANTAAGQAEIVSSLQSARNRIQQLLDSQTVPSDYRKAILDMMDTQVNTWRSIQNITSSPGYGSASFGNRMDLVVVLMKQNIDAYDTMNMVLRKYGLKEIDDTTGLF